MIVNFNETYIQYKPYLLKIIKRYIIDFDIAEDILQETFFLIWKYNHTFRNESHYKTWITRIAVNSALSYLNSNQYKKSKLENNFEDFKEDLTMSHPDYDSPEDCLSNRQDLDFAAVKIQKLKQQMRETLKLYVFDGLPYQDIAFKLNTTKFNIRNRLHKARWLVNPD